MSVINQVLKDLDRQGANASTPRGVIAVNQRDVAAPRWPLMLIGVAGVVTAVWWFWPGATLSSVSNPVAPPPVETPIENAPKLLMSQQLSAAGRTSEVPSASLLAPLADNAAGSSAAQSVRATAPATIAAVMPAIKPRLDTRLSEPRQTEIAKPTVVKEIKPLTPQVQAEEAWRQASRLLEQGRNHDAQDKLEGVLRLDPAHAGARQSLIALVLEAGDGVRAEALLREGLALHPNEGWYSRSLAQLQLQRGNTAQAAAILKSGLAQLQPQRADAANWGLYASTLAKLGKRSEATQAYREALRLDPTQGNWWIGLAVALEQGSENADAGAAYQRALQTRLSSELREFAQQKARELGAR
jgi:MSHA biogenesis protein MshN